MPIYLPAPEPDPRGPDGLGWNRISFGAHYGTPNAQCALRPRTYPTLADSRRDTRLSRWGYHKPCIAPSADGSHRRPNCLSCTIFTTPARHLDSAADRVLVRLRERLVGSGFATEAHDTPYVMEDPDRGWDSPHQQWEWEELARLEGWRVGRVFHDQYSRGFWLERMPPGREAEVRG